MVFQKTVYFWFLASELYDSSEYIRDFDEYVKDNYIESQNVVLEELIRKYFKLIIEWRNDEKNRRFINQKDDLTIEKQEKWYQNYINKDNEVLFVMIDKIKNIPFGTIGITEIDKRKKQCITGRLLVGNINYLGSVYITEACLNLYDYVFYKLMLDRCYYHVVVNNKKVISYNKRFGFKENVDTEYPLFIYVNGMKQIEMILTKENYINSRQGLNQY